MRIIIPILFVFGLLLSCGSEGATASGDGGEDNQVSPTNMEKKIDPEILALLDLVKSNPSDHDGNADKLNKVALAFMEGKKTRQAVGALNQSLRNHYSASSTPDNAFLLMNIYKDHFKTTDNASIMALAIKDAFPNFSKMDEVKALVPEGVKDLSDLINTERTNMSDPETGRLDFKKANKFVTASEIFAMMLPGSEKSPQFLQKAGEVARSIKAYPKSIEIYDWIINSYAQAPEAAQALFMKAFTYDNELNDKTKAKALYQEFLKKHPKNGFADDTQFLLDNIDKTNEDIIKGFGEKKK